MKVIRWFIISSGMVLTTTALAKVVSGFGTSAVLIYPEPLSGIPFKYVFWITGAIELCVAIVCLGSKRVRIQACLLAWLSTTFAAYRFCLFGLGQGPCPCLGNLTSALHIPQQVADSIMKIILIYLLGGSYAALIWLGKQGKHISKPVPIR